MHIILAQLRRDYGMEGLVGLSITAHRDIVIDGEELDSLFDLNMSIGIRKKLGYFYRLMEPPPNILY